MAGRDGARYKFSSTVMAGDGTTSEMLAGKSWRLARSTMPREGRAGLVSPEGCIDTTFVARLGIRERATPA